MYAVWYALPGVSQAKKLLPVLLLLLLAIPDSSFGFDGKRKGMIVGLGIGAAPIAHWSVTPSGPDFDEIGLAGNGLIGYAWDNQNAVVYEGNGCIYKSSQLGDAWVLQGLDAIRWYHYWGNRDRQAFTCVGIGLWVFDGQYSNINGNGFGYSAGIGYEISKKVQVGCYYNGGRTSNDYNLKTTQSVLTLLITVVAY